MRNTLVVRKAMKQSGAGSIFTNLYENCRTVKCYPGHLDDLLKFETNLKLLMASHGKTDYTVKHHSHAVIVRLPLEY